MNDIGARSRKKQMIQRLFDESKDSTPGQSPAIECHVTLASGGQISGALSVTGSDADDGTTLRMLTAARDERNMPVLIEHFFDFDQVLIVSVRREVTATPRIVRS